MLQYAPSKTLYAINYIILASLSTGISCAHSESWEYYQTTEKIRNPIVDHIDYVDKDSIVRISKTERIYAATIKLSFPAEHKELFSYIITSGIVDCDDHGRSAAIRHTWYYPSGIANDEHIYYSSVEEALGASLSGIGAYWPGYKFGGHESLCKFIIEAEKRNEVRYKDIINPAIKYLNQAAYFTATCAK